MARHSKWHNIQARKGKQDKVRANVFTKIARLITVAARAGGDPETNVSLRLAIDKAKAVNMPKDNIDRAVKRGTGELADEARLEEIIYEGFGPGGVAFLVEAVTDNKNRTAGDLKHIFAAHGGALGGPGSVQWQFAHVGVIRVTRGSFRHDGDVELALIDAGAEDIREEDNIVEVYSPVEKFQQVLAAVEKARLSVEDSGLEWTAKEKMTIADTAGADQLFEALDEHDDVKAVYTNL